MRFVSNEMYSFVYGYKKERPKNIVMSQEQFDKFFPLFSLKFNAMMEQQREMINGSH